MMAWLRRAAGAGGREWTEATLVDAAEGLAADDPARARAVAFAVAQATRAGDDDALRALAALLTGAPAICAFDEGTLVNVLSALQFALMLPDEVRADWGCRLRAPSRAP